MNITEPIRRNATLVPDAIAVTTPAGAAVTYRELEDAIERTGRHLVAAGVRAGAEVAMAIDDAYAGLVASLACARIGAAAAPKNFAAELRLATGGDAASQGRTLRADASWWFGPPAGGDPLPIDADATRACRIVRDSTGGFMAVTHDICVQRLYKRWLAVRLPDDARQMCVLDADSEFAFGSVLRVLWKQGIVVMQAHATPPDRAIRVGAVNTLVCDAATVEALVEANRSGTAPMRTLELVEMAHGAISDTVFDHARNRVCDTIVCVVENAEVGPIASAPRAALRNVAGGAGWLLPDVEVAAFDEFGSMLPPGSAGSLFARTDHAVPARNAKRDGWFPLAPFGRVSDEGLLTFLRPTSAQANATSNPA